MTIQLTTPSPRSATSTSRRPSLAGILGLDDPTVHWPFFIVQVDNYVSLDFVDDLGPVNPGHHAFLVGESEFDEIFGRLREPGLPYWADPGLTLAGGAREITTNDRGRGV
jgi:hypothetical protein